MPIYMDIHRVPGLEAIDAAKAHQQDMAIQHEYHCKCMTYWIDEPRGVVFCLIEATDRSSVEEMHRNSHGLVPNRIIDVNNDVVETFLGRIHDPDGALITDKGFKVFSDSAFRILLITDMLDPVLLRHAMGAENAEALLNRQNENIRKALSAHGGREVEHAGSSFIISFTSAAGAMACALEIQKNCPASDRILTGFKMAINAGEPVAKSDELFGDCIQLAKYLCRITSCDRIIISSAVAELLARDNFRENKNNIAMASSGDEALLEALFARLEENWQDPDFTVNRICQKMSMSKSRLYRKTIALWGLSPNQLLREFRLDKAKELLKKRTYNVTQATFDSGFSSPSYFTKCFKKKFGLLPAAYQNSPQ